ncbi:VOC family protein [Streptomyces oceani]|uniref:Hydroxylase n=1 Tax=Streptomyces oceani TaxID=1075402 RepID=A0A1E7KLK0_9ACTN|nr:VOC family protein [Streptomyces oceani]OEV04770.1 hydroxylase [Streptomyces oceani]
MITTDLVTGSPAWLDLGATDPAATAAFYGSVFGWQVRPYDPVAGGYGFFELDGKTVAAFGEMTDSGAQPAWMIYFRTADADSAAETVRQRGGTVRTEPSDVGEYGRLAQFTDPQGGEFAVWQPGTTPGLDTFDEPGALMWTELCTTDAAEASDFYRALFGWRIDDMTMPGGEGTYELLTPAGQSEDHMHGGIAEVGPEDLPMTSGSPYWHPVFHTADCDASVARVTESGGGVTREPADAEGVGRLAVCHDPAGAEFVFLTPRPG